MEIIEHAAGVGRARGVRSGRSSTTCGPLRRSRSAPARRGFRARDRSLRLSAGLAAEAVRGVLESSLAVPRSTSRRDVGPRSTPSAVERGDVRDCDEPPRLAHAAHRSGAQTRSARPRRRAPARARTNVAREHGAAADPPDGRPWRCPAPCSPAMPTRLVRELAERDRGTLGKTTNWSLAFIGVIRSLAAIGDRDGWWRVEAFRTADDEPTVECLPSTILRSARAFARLESDPATAARLLLAASARWWPGSDLMRAPASRSSAAVVPRGIRRSCGRRRGRDGAGDGVPRAARLRQSLLSAVSSQAGDERRDVGISGPTTRP